MPPSWRGWLRHLPALLGVGLLLGAIYVVQREFRHLRIADIERSLAAIPTHALAVSFGWTILSYGVLTFYDRLGTIYAGNKVSYRRVAFASFCAYALSHNIGFAAVSGAAVRYRLYAHWGLSPVQIAKVVAFCSLTFGLGGMVLGGSILFYEPGSVPFFGQHLPRVVLWAIGAALWAIVAGYVTLAKAVGTFRVFNHEIVLPGFRMAVVQVVLATVDVAVTASIFYALLPQAPGLTWLRFLAVYLASYSAGLVANLPGGLGVFDTALLLGLDPYLPAPVTVGAIVVFRLYYYIIPLFIAGSLFAGNEILLRGRTLFGRRLPWGRPQAGQATDQIPDAAARARWSEPDFAVAAGTGAVALCAAMLLSLGVLDRHPDLSWLDPDLVDIATSASEFVPSLIGAALMVLALGLSRRVTLAWGATIALLLLAAIVLTAQGEPFWTIGMPLFATLMIAPFRAAYYRDARLFSGPLQPASLAPLVALAGCVLALAAFEPHVRKLSETAWWEIILAPTVPNALRVTVALVVALALGATWRLIRPGRVTWLPWAGEGRLVCASLGVRPPMKADGVVLGEAGRSVIPFRRVGRVLLGLGDPQGAEADRISAIWRLRDLAQQEGLDPAVWLAGPGLLGIYGDLGLTALPLGRDGLPLDDGTAGSGRYLCCVAERDLKVLLPMLPSLIDREEAMAAERR